MKIGVSTYSFSQAMAKGMSLLDCIDKAAQMGFEGIEFVPFQTPQGREPAEYAAELARRCADRGLTVVCYSTDGNLAQDDPALFEREIARLCREADVAKALGAPRMRHDVVHVFPEGYRGMKTFGAALPTLAEGCRRVTRYAASIGIKTLVENHGRICQDPDRILRLAETVADDNFGLLCDIGNFTCCDENPAVAVGKVLPLVRHVHAKDMFIRSGEEPDPGRGWFRSRAGNYLRGTIVGHGDVPVTQCVRLLAEAGYDGFLDIEFEGIEDCIEGLGIGLENLRRCLAAVR